MKVALISPYRSLASHGVRSLSSYLKHKGVSVNVFFLCMDINTVPSVILCEKLVEFLRADSFNLVGVSLSTNYFNIARVITKHIKDRLAIPVIWGGIHPSIAPEECLEFADIVCVGEGENVLLDLCLRVSEDRDYSDIDNLCFLKDGKELKKNRLAPLIHDLDSLPFPDYDFTGHFIWDENNFCLMNEELFKKYQYIADRYETLTSRGCPYRCSYCCNNALQGLYGSKGYLRKRSPVSIVKELEIIKAKLPFVRSAYFDDDAFFSRSRDEIELFCKMYKERVGLPFSISGVHPLALTKEKLRLFVDAGLKRVKMGIQTGSDRISNLYKRDNIKKQRIIEVAYIINSFKKELEPPIYDFILDNPYETNEDLIDTLELVTKLPRPYELSLFSLTFFPGNELTEIAVRDGKLNKENIKDCYSKDHNRPSTGYFNMLFIFFNSYNCPGWVSRILINRVAIRLKMQFIFISIIAFLLTAKRLKVLCIKLMSDLARFDFSRIRRKLSGLKIKGVVE